MKILKLSAENFKRISVVEIKPDGNLVQITGKNGSGKTSCLDAIWATLEGAEHLQSVPIRRGADKATIQLSLGGDKVELIATRTIRAKRDEPGFNTTLTVETADGFRAPSPQAAMDKLMGRITMDPLAFTRMKPKEQFDQLRAFVPGVDFDDLAAKNKSDYAKRTEVNRDAKRARAAAEAVGVPDSIDAKTQPIDEAALTAELAGAGQHNASIETRKDRRATAADRVATLRVDADNNEAGIPAMVTSHEAARDKAIERLNREIDRLRRQIDDLEAGIVSAGNEAVALIEKDGAYLRGQAKRHRDEGDQLQEQLDTAEPLPEPIDTESLTARITEARHTNAAIRLRDRRAAYVTEAEALEADAERLTKAMEARDALKADAIAKAELPVPGLGFGDGVVTIDGLPFDQASDAQQLRTSIAIAIATAGPLRVIRVRDGSLLDDEGLKLVAEMADSADMQVWIEAVSNGQKIGFTLEDGHLLGVEPPPPETAEEPKPAKGGRDKAAKAGDLL
jgi:DNA repair exonuclease SbcCD ATPase subunit